MSETDLIPFIYLDVTIPVHEFRIEYEVVEKTDLPFVREFILRLLNIDSMDINTISGFIGLSKKETNVALEQAFNHDEIAVSPDGSLSLSAKSKGYFLGGDGSRPKINKIEDYTHNVKFDLIDMRHIESKGNLGGSFMSLVVYPEDKDIADSSTRAKKTFQKNFYKIIETLHSHSSEFKRSELYKIQNILKKRQKYYRIPLIFGFDPDSLIFDFTSLNEKLPSSDKFSTLFGHALRSIASTENRDVTANYFDRMDYFDGLRLLSRDKLDIHDYFIRGMKGKLDKLNMIPLVGSMCVPNNWKLVLSLLEKHLDGEENEEVVYVAPSVGLWGKSKYQVDLITNLSEKYNFKLYLPLSHERDRGSRKYFQSMFRPIESKLYGYQDGYYNGLCELIYVEGKFALSLIYLQVDNVQLPIPVGFYTELPDITDKVIGDFKNYIGQLTQDLNSYDFGPLVTRSSKE